MKKKKIPSTIPEMTLDEKLSSLHEELELTVTHWDRAEQIRKGIKKLLGETNV